MTGADERVRDVVRGEVEETDRRYVEAFGRTLPHLSRDELGWRFHAVLGVIIFRLLGTLGNLPGCGASYDSPEEKRKRTITFLATALRAPNAGPLTVAPGAKSARQRP